MRSNAKRGRTNARKLKAWIYKTPDGMEVYPLTPEGKIQKDFPNGPMKRINQANTVFSNGAVA
jgi:hypothetical protein